MWKEKRANNRWNKGHRGLCDSRSQGDRDTVLLLLEELVEPVILRKPVHVKVSRVRVIKGIVIPVMEKEVSPPRRGNEISDS